MYKTCFVTGPSRYKFHNEQRKEGCEGEGVCNGEIIPCITEVVNPNCLFFHISKEKEIYKRGQESDQNCLTHEQYSNEAIYTCIRKEKRMKNRRNRKRYVSDGSESVILYINQNKKGKV